jgi:hypothetical protein
MIEITLQQLENENTINPNPYVQHCLEEAKMHIVKAQEFLVSARANPQQQYEESLEFYKMMFKLLPVITVLQSYGSQLLGSEMEDNLSHTQSSTPSDEDNSEPATPPRH